MLSKVPPFFDSIYIINQNLPRCNSPARLLCLLLPELEEECKLPVLLLAEGIQCEPLAEKRMVKLAGLAKIVLLVLE